MARIDIPEGDGGELVQVWSLSPELGGAVGNLSAAVYGERLVSPRVREVARMRIAQITMSNRLYRAPGHQVFLLRALAGLDGALKALGTVRNWHRILQEIVAGLSDDKGAA